MRSKDEQTLDGQYELRHDGKDLGFSVVEQVMNASHREDVVRMICLDQRVEEQRQVVMVVQLLYLHLHLSLIHI